jgi:hypothetical protein
MMRDKKMFRPAICCVGYNRPQSMERLLKAIGRSYFEYDDIPLIISIDECDKSDEVQAVADDFIWEHGTKQVIRYPERQGLRKHILQCGDLSEKYGAVLIFEDDVLPASDFYNFTVQALNFYEQDDHIVGVGLFSQQLIFDRPFNPAHRGADAYLLANDISSGECWTKEKWKDFRKWYEINKDSLSENNSEIPKWVFNYPAKTSWCRPFVYYLAETNKYYVIPYTSLATNMGEAGTHSDMVDDLSQVPLQEGTGIQYRFVPYPEMVKYDLFLNRVDIPLQGISGIPMEKILNNISGYRYDLKGYEYMLSTELLDCEVLASWGINMDPPEANIINDNVGKGIYLYHLSGSGRYQKSDKKNDYLILHTVGRFNTRLLIYTVKLKLKNKIKANIRKKK